MPVPVELPSDQDASGRTFDDEELALLQRVVRAGTLISTKGFAVAELERTFAELLGCEYAVACSSGTAAIHTAVAAFNPEPGEEIVVSPITDMGAITPILYQAAVPVFADVDPNTGNITAATIEPCLSERTRAIIVTHLFGGPAEMEPVLELAASRGVPVIEDCAQAYLAEVDGRQVGSLGSIGCFSLQQGKHVSAGEGGLVVTNDAVLARRMRLFVNKAWGYGEPNPDHYFLALNYRMTELQGAVALAQLRKVGSSVQRRRVAAAQLTAALAGAPGLTTPEPAKGASHAYWKYPLLVDEAEVPGGSIAMAAGLRELGIASAPRYIQKPAFQCAVLSEQRTFGRSRFPFTLARPEAVDYAPERFSGVFAALERLLVLPWNERLTSAHVDYLAGAIRRRHAWLRQDARHG